MEGESVTKETEEEAGDSTAKNIHHQFKNIWFWSGHKITAKQRESKDQWKKISEKLKQYILQELQNPEDIIDLVLDLKDPMTVLDTSQLTALFTKYKKDPIIVMIQTEEIKQYVKICLW